MADTIVFLDERGTDDQRYYYVGGVALAPNDVPVLAAWVRAFKKRLKPELDPDAWYVKGSGEWLAPDHSRREDTASEAFARWEAFADELPSLVLPYSIHGCIVLRDKFLGRFKPAVPKKDRSRTIFRAALFPLLVSLELRGSKAVELYVDRVEGAQADAVSWAFDKVNRALEKERRPMRLIRAHNVAKDDFTSDVAQILQFVDIEAYALSRFVVPSGALSHILANFERWPYAITSGQRKELIASDPAEAGALMARYFRIVPIYHHLRSRMIKNHASPSGTYSSFAVMGQRDHWNFAADFDRAAWIFGNTMWEEWERSQIGIDLDAYE